MAWAYIQVGLFIQKRTPNPGFLFPKFYSLGPDASIRAQGSASRKWWRTARRIMTERGFLYARASIFHWRRSSVERRSTMTLFKRVIFRKGARSRLRSLANPRQKLYGTSRISGFSGGSAMYSATASRMMAERGFSKAGEDAAGVPDSPVVCGHAHRESCVVAPASAHPVAGV